MTAISLKALRPFQIPTFAIVLALTMGLPILFHLLPTFDSTPLGARILPMFFAPLIASLLYRPHVGLLAALCAPLINYSITAKPASDIFLILTIELVVFTFASIVLKKYSVPAIIHVLLSFSIAKLFCLICILYLPFQIYAGNAMDYFVSSSMVGLPGLVIMTLIAIYLIRVRKNVR